MALLGRPRFPSLGRTPSPSSTLLSPLQMDGLLLEVSLDYSGDMPAVPAHPPRLPRTALTSGVTWEGPMASL